MKNHLSEISEFSSHISEYENINSHILEQCETYLGAVERLIQEDSLEESLNALFLYLSGILPLTYLFYTPPYESQEASHIHISLDGRSSAQTRCSTSSQARTWTPSSASSQVR